MGRQLVRSHERSNSQRRSFVVLALYSIVIQRQINEVNLRAVVAKEFRVEGCRFC